MNEILRLILSYELEGTVILEKLINGEIKQKELTSKQVNKIMEAWDARVYVPIDKKKEAINSNPIHWWRETKEHYDRRHIARIVRILKKMK